jgi:hypothetical protein
LGQYVILARSTIYEITRGYYTSLSKTINKQLNNIFRIFIKAKIFFNKFIGNLNIVGEHLLRNKDITI